MKLLKLFVIILLCLVYTGCGSGHPVPKEAFIECAKKNWVIKYRSSSNITIFTCIPSKIKE